MGKGLSVLSLAVVVALAGCSVAPTTGEESGPSVVAFGYAIQPLPDEGFVAMLRAKAETLAKGELGRMAAVELTYRGKTEAHAMSDEFLGIDRTTLVKMYRNFTESRVSDIYRSESFLNPVAVEIHFDFEMMGTDPRALETPNAEAEAHKDLRFKVLGKFTLVRRYKCDAQGDYTGELPEILQRPDFYRRETWADLKEPGAALPNMLPPGGQGMQPGLPMAPVMDRIPSGVPTEF